MTRQISYPAGMVSHMVEERDGVPGVNLPTWAVPQRVQVTLFPLDMVQRGYVYIREESARNLRIGSPIQVDRVHARIVGIDRPETVVDAGPDPAERVRACRVHLSREMEWV